MGDSFKYSDLNTDYSNEDLADYLRSRTYLLDKNIIKAPPYGYEPPD